MRAQVCGVVLMLGASLILGCRGDPNARQAVSGMVYFNGKVLDQGDIRFIPAEKGASETGATIKDGKYTIPRELGLVPGPYKVSVFSYDRQGARVAGDDIPGEPGKQFKQRIAAKYNTQTTLKAEVTSSGSNVFDFRVD